MIVRQLQMRATFTVELSWIRYVVPLDWPRREELGR